MEPEITCPFCGTTDFTKQAQVVSGDDPPPESMFMHAGGYGENPETNPLCPMRYSSYRRDQWDMRPAADLWHEPAEEPKPAVSPSQAHFDDMRDLLFIMVGGAAPCR